jgi:hypothetical protein
VSESLNSARETTSTTASYGGVDITSSSSHVQCYNNETLVNSSCVGDIDATEVNCTSETVCCVNLCGAVTLQDVRHLLKEWIHSTPGNIWFVIKCTVVVVVFVVVYLWYFIIVGVYLSHTVWNFNYNVTYEIYCIKFHSYKAQWSR